MKLVDLMINLLDGLYDLNDKTKTQLRANAEEIERAFDGYLWDDIKRAINYYYVRKNDKTRPTIAKILAILDTDPATQRFVSQSNFEIKQPQRPETKIREIAVMFDRVVNLLAECKVIDTGVKTQGLYFLVDSTGRPVLDVQNRLKFEIEKIKLKNPPLFQKYGPITWIEALAIAIDNNLVHLRFRDNRKFLKILPADILRLVHNRDTEATTKAIHDWPGTKTEEIYTL